jgi:hypothetical protein
MVPGSVRRISKKRRDGRSTNGWDATREEPMADDKVYRAKRLEQVVFAIQRTGLLAGKRQDHMGEADVLLRELREQMELPRTDQWRVTSLALRLAAVAADIVVTQCPRVTL